MASIFIRTLAVYVMLIAIMRFLGKRQIGEMQISELVTTFLLSELASQPLTNTSVPLALAFVPVVTLVCLEVAFSFLPTKLPFLKKLLDSKPSIIIGKGKIDRREMMRMRMSLEDLLCELHISGFTSPEEIEYAILEPNGKLSFLPKAAPEGAQGIAHPVIIDGKCAEYALRSAGKDRAWLARELAKRHTAEKDIFLMTV
ncbi:MAG: DUF421 domain-containing protein, partial [Clostridia bacterium]|nr:DUF421 domain-containing protein [Clostridia bacterium]